MRGGQDTQPRKRSRYGWLGYGFILGGITLFMLVLGVGVREIIREVPEPSLFDEGEEDLQNVKNGSGAPLPTTATANLALTSGTLDKRTTHTTVASHATTTTPRGTGLTALKRGPTFSPNGYTVFQSIKDQYLDYLNRKDSLSREQALKSLKTISDRMRNWDQEYFRYLHNHNLPMPTQAEWTPIVDFNGRLRSALDLEPMILNQEWEIAAYFCRSNQGSYRWETELYFLKQIGPEGYLMILKRAPQHWWDKVRRGKFRSTSDQRRY